MSGNNTKSYGGFTLVEILVALTLFSLVLAMIFSGLRSAAASWEKSNAQIAQNDSSRLDLGFVRKQLSQTVPLVLLDGKDNPVLFKGEHDVIRFISDLPGHRGGGGLYVLSLKIVEHEHSKDLIMTYWPVMTDINLDNPVPDDENVKSITILENIDLLEFSYFGSEDEKTDPVWSDEWRAKRSLPQLVRMHIVPVRTDDYIPDITVKLHTGSVRGQPQLILYKGDLNRDHGGEPTNVDPSPGTDQADTVPPPGMSQG